MFSETNENGKIMYQNFRDAAKGVLRRKFIVINAHIKIKGKSQINNLILHFKDLKKNRLS